MPISVRPDRGDVPQLGDPAFDALLARVLRPEEAVASLRPVVEGFAALYAAPVQSGPAAESSALAAFRGLAAFRDLAAAVGNRTGVHRTSVHRTSVHRAGVHRAGAHRPGRVHRFRLASAGSRGGRSCRRGDRGQCRRSLRRGAARSDAAAGTLRHRRTSQPPRGTPQRVPVVPGLSPTPGSSAYGLCQAYELALAQGQPEHDPVTLRRLAAAAGGAARVTVYCAQLVHPGKPSAGHPAHTQPGKPSAQPTPHGKPTPAANRPR